MPAMPAMPSVRKATRADVPALAAALARAFHDDPAFRWMFPDEPSRLASSERYFSVRARQLLAQDEVYTTEDIAGAALWTRPDRWGTPARELLPLLAVAPSFGRRLPRVLRGLESIEARHPGPAHFYLAVLGTDPAAQGRGVGSALLTRMLEQCDRDDVPAYLETATERNIAFYARHGFDVTDQLTLPKGPPVWLMWRDAGR